MKIQFASDLHLEFPFNSKYIKEHPLEVAGDILVLAGDICVFNTPKTAEEEEFWDWASKNYKQVIAIPGNHEFYKKYDLSNLHDGWTMKIRENVTYYYNCVIPIDDETDLIATTLWSHISEENAPYVVLRVSDFKSIYADNDPIDPQRFNKEHERCFKFLQNSIKNSKAKYKVVVTHHVPSSVLVCKKHRGTPINEAFSVELKKFIKSSGVNYWIYGHSHINIDATIGRTKCVSNQMGYVQFNEGGDFVNSRCIELTDKCKI